MAIEVLDEQAFEDALDAGGWVVVDYYADWCGPCRSMAPHFEAAAEGELGGKVRFAKLDTEATPSLAREAGVSSIPTTILFHGTTEVGRVTGAMNRRQLEQFVTDAIWQVDNV